MATMQATVLALLNDDAGLSAEFTGGFLDWDNLPNDGLTTDNIQKETNGVTIRATGVARWRGPRPRQGTDKAAEWTLDIYLYDDPARGRQKIAYAKRRVWALLHDVRITNTDHHAMVMLHWLGDLGEPPEGAKDAVLEVNMDRTSYQVVTLRKTT